MVKIDYGKKGYKLALIAIVFALIGWTLPDGSINYFNNTSANTSGIVFVVNNTNLAPDVAGHPTGTGERIQNQTYWANNSPIQLMVFAHADTSTQAIGLNLSINNTVVEQTHLRPLGISENTHAYITAIIPQYSNYSVNITNYHHYEWREYQVLTGNVTTNITTSGSGGGCAGNCSYDQIYVNTIDMNTSRVNLKNVTNITSYSNQCYIDFNSTLIYICRSNVSTAYSGITASTTETQLYAFNSSTNNFLYIYPNRTENKIDSTTYTFNRTYLDMNGANINILNNTNTVGATYGVNLSYSGGIGTFGFSDNPSLNQSNFRAMSGRTFIGNTNYLGQYTNVGYVFSLTAYDKLSASYAARGFRLRYFPESSTSATTLLSSNEAGTTIEAGNFTVTNLSGAGNAYVCVDSAGKLYRGSPGC